MSTGTVIQIVALAEMAFILFLCLKDEVKLKWRLMVAEMAQVREENEENDDE